MLSESEQSAIMRSLENVLADAKFAGSPQMSAFLRYVVVEALQGNADRIKAYTVAVDALGKTDSFDPQNDPSVRVLAKRLRTALSQYYERTDNHEKIIEIRAGSYKPIFSDPKMADEGSKSTAATGLNRAVTCDSEITSRKSHGNSQFGEGNRPNINGSSAHSLPTLANQTNADENYAAPSKFENIPTLNDVENVPGISIINAINTKLRNVAGYFNAFKIALFRKRTSGALLFLVLCTVLWRFSFDNTESIATEQTAQPAQDQYVLQLASSNGASRLRPRPSIPTVIVQTKNREDTLSQSLHGSLVHILSKFDHIHVLNSTHEYELSEKWPEDYEIVLDALTLNDSRKLTVNLVNATSGQIVYSDVLKIAGGTDAGLDEENIAAVSLAVARIVQKDGPLIANYKSQAKYSEAMACLFSIGVDSHTSEIDENCDLLIDKVNHGEPFISAIQAELSLSKYSLEGKRTKKEALADALLAVKNNLDLAPHSADAHALAMRAYQLSGDHDSALIHGRRAIAINEMDGKNIHDFSLLLAELNQIENAERMLSKARILSVGSSDISL